LFGYSYDCDHIARAAKLHHIFAETSRISYFCREMLLVKRAKEQDRKFGTKLQFFRDTAI